MASLISCETARRWIALAVDNELPPEGEPYLESHLDFCLRCRLERDRAFSRQGSIGIGAQEVTDEIEGLLKGQLGVEQLDRDPRVEAGRDSNRLLLLGAAVLLLGFSIWALNRDWTKAPPLPALTANLVTWGAKSEGGPPVQRGVEAGEIIRVEEQGLARLTIGKLGAVIEIGGGGVVKWPSSSGRESSVLLLGGVIRCEIDPRGRGFEVRTSNISARVIGTRFLASYSSDRSRSEISVEEGVVLVTRDEVSGEFEVKADERVVVVNNKLRFYPAPNRKVPGPSSGEPDTGEKPEVPIDEQQSGGNPRRGSHPLDLPGNRGSGSNSGGDDGGQ